MIVKYKEENTERKMIRMEDKEPRELKTGRYRHYKGNDYDLLGVARHSETGEEFAVYQAPYGDRELWIRPLTMFLEEVEVAGKKVPRFERVDV